MHNNKHAKVNETNKYDLFDAIVDNILLEKVNACRPDPNLPADEQMLTREKLGQVRTRITCIFCFIPRLEIYVIFKHLLKTENTFFW